jgi:uncharacterized protein (DUF433 family)
MIVITSQVDSNSLASHSATNNPLNQKMVLPQMEANTNSTIYQLFVGTYSISGVSANVPDLLINKTPGTVGGEARIRNTRIPVWSLVQLRNLGMSETEIKSSFEEPLSDADLSAAWGYYLSRKKEIDEAIGLNEAE